MRVCMYVYEQVRAHQGSTPEREREPEKMLTRIAGCTYIYINMYRYAHVYLYIYIQIHMFPARGPQRVCLCNHCFAIIFAIYGSFSSSMRGGGAPKSREVLGAGASRSRIYIYIYI